MDISCAARLVDSITKFSTQANTAGLDGLDGVLVCGITLCEVAILGAVVWLVCIGHLSFGLWSAVRLDKPNDGSPTQNSYGGSGARRYYWS